MSILIYALFSTLPNPTKQGFINPCKMLHFVRLFHLTGCFNIPANPPAYRSFPKGSKMPWPIGTPASASWEYICTHKPSGCLLLLPPAVDFLCIIYQILHHHDFFVALVTSPLLPDEFNYKILMTHLLRALISAPFCVRAFFVPLLAPGNIGLRVVHHRTDLLAAFWFFAFGRILSFTPFNRGAFLRDALGCLTSVRNLLINLMQMPYRQALVDISLA